jgi:hypothetical protein
MDNMANSSKQKAVATWTPQEIPNSGDWRSRGLDKVPTEEETAAVQLPFKIYPETAVPPHQDPPQQPLNTLAQPSSDPGHYLLGGLGNCCPTYRDNNDDPFSSNTARRRGGNPPDPYGDPWAKNQNDRNDNGGRGGSRLEEDPLEYFEGDRNKTMDFLVAFKRFMIMN